MVRPGGQEKERRFMVVYDLKSNMQYNNVNVKY